jgi:hypothetical protein
LERKGCLLQALLQPRKQNFAPNLSCANVLQKPGAKIGDSVVMVPPRVVNESMEKVPRGNLMIANLICKQLVVKTWRITPAN